ncbi:MAG TPA: dihydrodipicolinate synthase family protein, partial [Slackia equolifaciens]|nr:dihydrodipicolinate synthase family protein [Slackia equolifaciens]
MKKAEFIVPVVTVFDERGEIDLDANVRVWEELIERGVDGILLSGSNGEFFTLSGEERARLTEAAAA